MWQYLQSLTETGPIFTTVVTKFKPDLNFEFEGKKDRNHAVVIPVFGLRKPVFNKESQVSFWLLLL